MTEVNAYDRMRIAVLIVANPRTVARVYQGKGSSYSRLRVIDAAKALGLPLPGDIGRGALRLVRS